TVMCGNRPRSWKMVLQGRLFGGSIVMSAPPKKMRPSVGCTKPPIICNDSGLARAGRTQQSDEVSLWHVQGDVGNDRLVVDLGHPMENYGGGKVHSASSLVGRTETVESG